MRKLIEKYYGQNSYIYRAKLSISYYLVIFLIVYTCFIMIISRNDKSIYYSVFDLNTKDTGKNLTNNSTIISTKEYIYYQQLETNIPSNYIDNEFKLNKSEKYKCPSKNENYAFKQIEIDGVKYPKYEYESLLNNKYNYSCLNELSKITKKIYFWYGPLDSRLKNDSNPLEDCPVKNCEFHDNIVRINESDAVFIDFFNVIHVDKNVTPNYMNSFRNPNQKWVFKF